jgi:hypothetical protein
VSCVREADFADDEDDSFFAGDADEPRGLAAGAVDVGFPGGGDEAPGGAAEAGVLGPTAIAEHVTMAKAIGRTRRRGPM